MLLNELQAHKEVKRIVKLGVPKRSAKTIVWGVMESKKCNKNISKAVNYAIALQFGIWIKK